MDALNESAYLQLMRLHALNDDRAGALQVYHTCSTVLMRVGRGAFARYQTLA
ncbi:MAG: hypothetical protein U0Z26_10225 [Anaerolineales bacterium]